MLIRSQDKTILINLNTMQGITVGQDGRVTSWHDGKVNNVLGQYSTEEKAIKVLDMIQDYYINVINTRCKVYQMPKDSEVKRNE